MQGKLADVSVCLKKKNKEEDIRFASVSLFALEHSPRC